MRNLLRVTALAFLIALAGCKSSSSSRGGMFSRTSTNGNKANNPNNLFLGSPDGASGGSSAVNNVIPQPDSGSLASAGPTRREGVLAGRILDQESKLRPGAIIQVIDMEAKADESAPLSVLANRDGYFDISGLEAGRSYRLVARVKDGGRTIAGSARVVPPNVRVAIWLNEDHKEEEAPKPSGPAASLGTPIKTPGGSITTPAPDSDTASNPVPPAVTTGDTSLIANDGVVQGDPKSPKVNVPAAPGREHTPEKPSNAMPPPPGDTAPPVEAPPSTDSAAKVDGPRVPSCEKVGKRIVNFALFDTKGEVYELAKDRKGKLVLIDLWKTDCRPCLEAVPHLNKLHTTYSRHGLEILGVAYEKGTLAEKQAKLERTSQRLNLTFQYKMLFGNGGPGRCPLARDLEQQFYPTMVLLDETGKVVYRAEGMDPKTAYELECAIYERLFPRRAAGR